jgi:hypothetical protein
MTNKLPEVGKRYKHKTLGTIYKAFKFKAREGCYFMESQSETLDLMANLCDFWEEFEELPDSQEKSEVQLTESIVSEVEKAKEELKWQITNDGWSDAKQSHDRLLYFAQNLIDALETEELFKKSVKGTIDKLNTPWVDWKDIYRDVAGVVKDKIKKEEMDILFGKNQEETKKEEKQSIWKPISELPGKGSDQVIIKVVNQNTKEITNIIGYYYDNFERFIPLNDEEMEFLKKGIKEWCYLTDFINDIEQPQLSHEERLRKLEGNDI